jgi:hypothetical protein
VFLKNKRLANIREQRAAPKYSVHTFVLASSKKSIQNLELRNTLLYLEKLFLMKPIIILLIFMALFVQCASSYKPVAPESMEYIISTDDPDLEFSYRYDVLSYRGNNKYSKKEKKHGFAIAAVKVKNKTDHTLNFARDLELLTQRGPVYPAENEYTAKTIKQGVAIYLLYVFANYSQSECVNGDCKTTLFIPSGFVLALINIIVAASANQKIKEDFNKNSLYGKDIGPGETVHGIIAIRDLGYQPLSLRVKKKEGN